MQNERRLADARKQLIQAVRKLQTADAHCHSVDARVYLDRALSRITDAVNLLSDALQRESEDRERW